MYPRTEPREQQRSPYTYGREEAYRGPQYRGEREREQEQFRGAERYPEEAWREGVTTRAIERRTARMPSGTFLALAGSSMLGSLALQIAGQRHLSLFVGQWAPTLLIMGMYNKLVKLEGHERPSRGYYPEAYQQPH